MTDTRNGIYNEVGLPLDGCSMYVNDVRYGVNQIKGILADREALQARNDRLSKELNEARTLRNRVRTVFAALVSDEDLDRDTANEALEELDIDLLATRYAGTVTVEYDVSFETTLPIERVGDALEDANLDMSIDMSMLDDFEVNSARVTNTEYEEDL